MPSISTFDECKFFLSGHLLGPVSVEIVEEVTSNDHHADFPFKVKGMFALDGTSAKELLECEDSLQLLLSDGRALKIFITSISFSTMLKMTGEFVVVNGWS